MKNLLLLISLFSFSSFSAAYSAGKKPSPKKALVFPVSGKRSSVGGYWGEYREGNRRHKGIDIYARKGTPVVAVSDGQVTLLSNAGKGGKCVWIKSADHPWTAYYAHLDKQKVRSGQFVRKGQIIGTVGNTGNARYTPSHLHFGIYKGSSAVNPLPYVKKSPKIILAPAKKTSSKNATVKKSKVVKSQLQKTYSRN